MGLLDDAIREHLELKRSHGASEEEIALEEAEALSPARRDVSALPEEEDEGPPPSAAEAGSPSAGPVEDLARSDSEAPPSSGEDAPTPGGSRVEDEEPAEDAFWLDDEASSVHGEPVEDEGFEPPATSVDRYGLVLEPDDDEEEEDDRDPRGEAPLARAPWDEGPEEAPLAEEGPPLPEESAGPEHPRPAEGEALPEHEVVEEVMVEERPLDEREILAERQISEEEISEEEISEEDRLFTEPGVARLEPDAPPASPAHPEPDGPDFVDLPPEGSEQHASAQRDLDFDE